MTGARRRSPLATVAAVDRTFFGWLTRRDHPVLDRTMPVLSRAADHGLLWLCLAALMAASGRPELRRAAARATVSLAVASATANGIAKIAIRRIRPPLDTVPALRRVRRLPVTTSFPSGHASSAAAFVVGAAREAPGVAAPLGLLAAGVGLSRVWTGAHYPADVLVGAALGAAVGRALPSAGVTGPVGGRAAAPPTTAGGRRGDAARGRP